MNKFFLLIFSLIFVSCQINILEQENRIIEEANKYQAEITRDIWGVPHVYGKRNSDMAFGIAFAHAEDDIKNIAENMYLYRAQMGLKEGADGAVIDYLIKALKIRERIDEQYDSELSLEVREIIEAYAIGLNYWMIQNPNNKFKKHFPFTPKDIVAGFAIQNLLFSGVVTSIQKLEKLNGNAEQSFSNLFENENFVIGSNAYAINSDKSNDGSTRLMINSHQPLEGPLAWYEAHIQSDEGINIMGGLFPGSPFIFVGFNENLGWGFTVNKPDLTDIYRLVINPNNNNQYLLDDEWVDLKVEEIELPVKIFGPINWTVKRDVKYSKHGPVIEIGKKSYALRFSGMEDIKQVDQWFRLNKASNLQEWQDAMNMRSIISFNGIYADKKGNIFFIHNSSSPKRLEGLDWKDVVDGSRSKYIWNDYVALNEIPQILNPSSGWLASTNQDPFEVSAPSDNLKKENYSETLGLQTRMTNRAYRIKELFMENNKISENDFDNFKFDNSYSKSSRSYKYVSTIFDKEFEEDKLIEGQKILKDWNLKTDLSNKSAALGVCVLSPEWLAEQEGIAPPVTEEVFRDCVSDIDRKYGRLDPEWSERNFMYRGDRKVPVQGGPDVLRAIYGLEEIDNDLKAVGGDGLYIHISWDKKGSQDSKSIHQYGSATQDNESKHYDDQLELFIEEKFKNTFFEKSDLKNNIEKQYLVPLKQSQ